MQPQHNQQYYAPQQPGPHQPRYVQQPQQPHMQQAGQLSPVHAGQQTLASPQQQQQVMLVQSNYDPNAAAPPREVSEEEKKKEAELRDLSFLRYLWKLWIINALFHIVDFALILSATTKAADDVGDIVWLLPAVEVAEILLDVKFQHNIYTKIVRNKHDAPLLPLTMNRRYGYTVHFVVELFIVLLVVLGARDQSSVFLGGAFLLAFDGFSSLGFIILHRRVQVNVENSRVGVINDSLVKAIEYDDISNGLRVKLLFLVYFAVMLVLIVVFLWVFIISLIFVCMRKCCHTRRFFRRHWCICCPCRVVEWLAFTISSSLYRYPQYIGDKIMGSVYGVGVQKMTRTYYEQWLVQNQVEVEVSRVGGKSKSRSKSSGATPVAVNSVSVDSPMGADGSTTEEDGDFGEEVVCQYVVKK